MDINANAMPCIGVVLAGGQSSRMGRDKAMLPWQGRPLLEHQIAVLQETGVTRVQVSGERPDYQGIADPVAQAGPLGGIAGVAAACENGELLVIPIDMPRLQPVLLQRLLDAPAAGCVRFDSHVLPMRLRLDEVCRGVLSALMQTHDDRSRSLQALQQRVGVIEISLSSDEVSQLIDCNTAQTWHEVAG
jgi:molybdenum cofactor guanylyltransferase